MKTFVIFLLLLLLVSCKEQKRPSSESNYTVYVNPFIGTDGTGHTFPGPCMPFGMVQPGPDNTDQGWDYTSGYQLKDSVIIGFSQTRASGTGISEFGDVLLLPFSEKNPTYSTRKISERAEVGYYEVALHNGVNVELTATERVAFHRYTFPEPEGSVYLNLQHGLQFLTDSLVLASEVIFEDDQQTVSGFCHTKNWVERKYFFTLVFDQPFIHKTELVRKPNHNASRFVFDFILDQQKQLQCKVALSSVDIAGAKKNLEAEIPDWDFEAVRNQAKSTWNSFLSRIEIEAPTIQKEIFYTALYHFFIHPSNIADVDGRYRGVDDQIAVAENNEYYSTLSLWDTYRGSHPLFTLIAPDRVPGFVRTMLAHSRAQGFLPIWTAWGQENYCMIGNHAIPVIVDAWMKGFEGFSAEEALQAMIKSTSENHLNSDWDLYNQYGYYPFDRLDNEAVSRTLESGFDDYCVALMAEKMGKHNVAEAYDKRSQYYRNLFDPGTGLMRGRNTDGNWRTPFDPLTPTSPMNNPGDYTEANAWQYSWAPTQYDVDGYIELLGGREAFTRQLDSFFTIQGTGDNKHLGQEAMIGQYSHGNEPSHHIAYLYAYSTKPKKGRELITRIYRDFYHNTPDGITGNDDCGQMSAWYILTTLGFYPVNPANATFVAGIPQVSKAIVHLGEGKALIMETNLEGVSGFSGITFNGESLDGPAIPYRLLARGGHLFFR